MPLHIDNHEISYHGVRRMYERGITVAQVRRALRIGVAVHLLAEERTKYVDGALHVVVSHNDGSIVTVYRDV